MDRIWAIILAAGASTRMGKQKLLLPYNGKTVIETVIETAGQVVGQNVMVILGSHYKSIKNQIESLSVKICVNKNYMDGMLSSVICGFQDLPETAETALIFLGDQPQIPSAAGIKVIRAWENSAKGIVIPVFKGRRGHPALIETKYKSAIQKLDPNKGLRQLMLDYKKDVKEIECDIPEILRDIDTPEDYKYEKEMKLIKNKS